MLENMKMEQLEYFGIPPYLINIWKEQYSDYLLPVQEKAIREFSLLQHNSYSSSHHPAQMQKNSKNLLVHSPSSSGKTLLAEIAALQEITLQKKVIYLVPLRVLAEEKYRHFHRLYHSIGLQVKFSSSDHRRHDEDIIRGNFHIAVIVYEKFSYLLLQYPKFMNNVSLTIADEIQFISDLERGPKLEGSFNYLKNNYPDLRIIALSAFSEYLLPLSHWLEAKLLTSSYRPVELRKGIVRNGIYRYREHNSKATGEEYFFPPEEVRECDLAGYLKATLKFLIKRQETSLIFFSTKKEVRLWSSWLAEELSLEPAHTALEQLLSSEDSTSKEELTSLLQNGVGYHCADLTFPERQALENSVRAGELKVICATGTLAMGVNLPVNNVILTGQKVISRSASVSNSPDNLPHYRRRALTYAEVENMGGRAGRLNFAHSFGRIIFLAPSLLELTTYQQLYFAKGVGDIPETLLHRPVVIQQDLLSFLLYKIAFGCTSLEDILEILQTDSNKKSSVFWLHKFSQKYTETDIKAGLNRLEKKGLVIPPLLPADKNYEINEMGQLVTAKGITFATYIHFLKWIKESEKGNISELEILLLIATSHDGVPFFTDYPGSGSRIVKTKKKNSAFPKWKEYLRLRILNLIFEQQEEGKPIFQHYIKTGSLEPVRWQAKKELSYYLTLKNVLLMQDWIRGKELRELEEEYGILGGSIQKIGEGFSWLADTLAALAAQLGWKEERALDLEKIQQLSARLITGITTDGLALARLQIPRLTRGYITRLLLEGYNHPDCLKELSEQQLEQLLPARLVTEIKDKLDSGSLSSESEQKTVLKVSDQVSKYLTAPLLPDEQFKQTNGSKGQSLSVENWLVSTKNIAKQPSNLPVLVIDCSRPDRILFLQEEIPVNKIGFQLMFLLAQNQGKMLSYEQIIDHLWPDDMDATYHRLWYHLAKLRNATTQIIRKKEEFLFKVSYLQEKLLRVIPGRGLLLDEKISLEIKE